MNSIHRTNITKITPKQTVYHIINSTLRKERENIALKEQNTALKEENKKLKETIQRLTLEIQKTKNNGKCAR